MFRCNFRPESRIMFSTVSNLWNGSGHGSGGGSGGGGAVIAVAAADLQSTAESFASDDTTATSFDIEFWKTYYDDDLFGSPMAFDASEGGLWNGRFVPPPPRPPFIDDSVITDGLTTCDLCTWAFQEKNAFSLEGSFGKCLIV